VSEVNLGFDKDRGLPQRRIEFEHAAEHVAP
jgi:hypothetical protein